MSPRQKALAAGEKFYTDSKGVHRYTSCAAAVESHKTTCLKKYHDDPVQATEACLRNLTGLD